MALTVFCLSTSFAQEPQFLNRLHQFDDLFKTQIAGHFLSQVANSSTLLPAQKIEIRDLTYYALTIHSRMTTRFEQLYRRQFMGEDGDSSLSQIDQIETDISILANQLLRRAAELLKSDHNGRMSARIIKNYKQAATQYSEYEKGVAIPRGIAETFRMVSPLRRTTGTFICTLLGDMCIQNKSVLDIFSSPNLTHQVRKPGTKLQLSRPLETLPIERDSYIFAVMNHDTVMLDATLLTQLTDKLGPANNFVIIFAGAYPHLKIWNNPDPHVFAAEDKNMTGKMLSSLQNTQGRVIVGVFPEGNRSTFGAQLPLSTKPGVVLMALRLAQKVDRPVYILPMRYNSLEYMTSDEATLKVDIANPIRVAKSKNFREDMENLRRQIEDFINYERGERILDLQNPKAIAGTWGLFYTSEQPNKRCLEFFDDTKGTDF